MEAMIPPLSTDAVLTDSDVRYLAIRMINAETARDRQVQLGASSISNPCDNCLAAEFKGEDRTSEFRDRPFLGRSLGTLFHNGLEGRIDVARELHPGARAEHRVICGIIPGYGPIPGHIDLSPTSAHVIDWKGSERDKTLPLIDYIEKQNGREPIYGRRHRAFKAETEYTRIVIDKKTEEAEWVKITKRDVLAALSEKEWEEQQHSMAHKYQWYYGQNQLYQRGAGARRGSLVFINRDGTGYFDNPEYSRYEDPTAVHDVFVLSFNRDDAYADALLQRATDIFQQLQQGRPVGEFDSADHCHFCKEAAEDLFRRPDLQFDGLFGDAGEVAAA